jgi:CBS domain-containing protein
MSQPLKTIDGAAPGFAALRLMLDAGIHHLPVTDNGKIIGVMSASDLLLYQRKSPLYLRGAVEQKSTPERWPEYREEVADLIGALFRGGLDALHISQIVSSLNDALTRRIIAVAAEKLGAPPAPFAWIVFGSEGRLEQAMLTDQDNGLIYAEESPGAGEYFGALAQSVIDGLICAGFPPCPGGFMATRWRRSLTKWQELFRQWIRLPNPDALLEASIFFDFRAVAGTLELGPLEDIILSSKSEKRFLAHMARDALRFYPPLSLLNRLRLEQGKIDVKAGGIAPIVGLARAGALAAGSSARSTLDRLAAASSSDALLAEENARLLSEVFLFLLDLRLRSQLAARTRAQPLDHKVNVSELSTLERRRLRTRWSPSNGFRRISA